MAEHADVTCNLQWYVDQFYKPWHRSFSQRGYHSIRGPYGTVDTKFLGCTGSSPAAYELSHGSLTFYWTHFSWKNFENQHFQDAFLVLQKLPFFDNYSFNAVDKRADSICFGFPEISRIGPLGKKSITQKWQSNNL